MFPILAAVCFLLVLLGTSVGFDLIALGLLFLALALLVGNWPFGPWSVSTAVMRRHHDHE